MGMNPKTNRLERLHVNPEAIQTRGPDLAAGEVLLRPDGSPVPAHWSVFREGEVITVKNYQFRVVYIGETSILLEPAGPVLLGDVART
jgi:hypothetical protein